MKTTPVLSSTKLLLTSAAFALCAFVSAQETLQMNSLVIDQGVDLAHNKLKNNVNFNTHELQGKKGIDDDQNGFIDDLAGWNSISNDGIYMPSYVVEKFTKDPSKVKKLLDLYTAVENGDAQARRAIGSNPSLIEQISELLELAHGTHVAGIVNSNSLSASRLQSINVFEGSQPEQAIDVPVENHFSMMASTYASLKSFATILQLMDVAPSAARKSFLDDVAEINKLLAKMESDNKAEYTALSKYVVASKSKVANLSLGIAQKNIRERLDQMWDQELDGAGLPSNTARTAAQEANYQLLLNGIYSSSAKGWGILFAENPDVLFVIAAGNDGEAEIPDAGNIDINPVTPADQSVNFPNVITVAATDKEGVITDFSCFSSKKVNIAAWGKAVPSLAPGHQMVAMSGTSMASPLVAGVATRIRAINPKLTAAQTRALIERTGRKLEALSNKVSTGAMIDAEAAFLAAQNSINNPLNMSIAKVLSSRVSNRARISNNILDLGVTGMTLDLDTTHRGQISETPDLVKDMMRKFDLF